MYIKKLGFRFVSVDWNALKKKFRILIRYSFSINLPLESLFQLPEVLKHENAWKWQTFTVFTFLKVKKWFRRQINLKTIPNYYSKFFFQSISTKTNKFKISIFYIQNLCSSPTKLKGFGGFRATIIFFWKDQILILGNTWKIPEAWKFLFFVYKSISQKRPEKWVKKSSRKKFGRARPEELRQFHF